MPLDNYLQEEMKRKSKTELVQIIIKSGVGYEPGALNAAKEELKRRKMSGAEFNQIRNQGSTAQSTSYQQPSSTQGSRVYYSDTNEPLELPFKIVCVLMPMFGVILGFIFSMGNNPQKSKDAWKFTGIGFLIQVVIILLMVALGRSLD